MSQKRLVAHPNLGIMDIQVILGNWNKYKDFDLLTFLECPDHQKWSWKTAPNVAWMSKTADMISAFLRVAPNGALQSQKVKGALRVKDFSKLQDQSLSILRHWCLTNATFVFEHMRKASAEEKLAIDSALSLMHLETVQPDGHPKICQDLVCHLQSFMTLDGSLSSKLFSGRNTYASDAACALSE